MILKRSLLLPLSVFLVAALALLWRGFCEFYVVVFRISEDLRVLREREEPGSSQNLRSQDGSLF